MEPADTAVMRMPPRRPDEALLSRTFLQTIGVYASMITGVVLAVFAAALDGDLERARTMAFSTLAVAQIFHLGNARSAGPVLRPARALANVYALGAVALSVGLQVAVVHYEPLASVLQLVPLTAADWAVVVAAGVIPGVAGQVAKLLRSGS
jgi:Ca2+-transporting ATPase